MISNNKLTFLAIVLLLLFHSCTNNNQVKTTPWGTTIVPESESSQKKSTLSLDDIVSNGELIMVTLSGPDTYYDYHNSGMGLQYLLCQNFAEKLGVSLRVDICRDTTEMIKKVKRGEADVIAFQLPTTDRIVLLWLWNRFHKDQMGRE